MAIMAIICQDNFVTKTNSLDIWNKDLVHPPLKVMAKHPSTARIAIGCSRHPIHHPCIPQTL